MFVFMIMWNLELMIRCVRDDQAQKDVIRFVTELSVQTGSGFLCKSCNFDQTHISTLETKTWNTFFLDNKQTNKQIFWVTYWYCLGVYRDCFTDVLFLEVPIPHCIKACFKNITSIKYKQEHVNINMEQGLKEKH